MKPSLRRGRYAQRCPAVLPCSLYHILQAQYENEKQEFKRFKEKSAARDSDAQGDAAGVLARIKRDKQSLEAELNKQIKINDDEAQRAKTLEESVDAANAQIRILRNEKKILEERVASSKSVTGIFQKEFKGSEDKRKAILEADKKQKLETALDPQTAKAFEAVTWNIAAVNNNPFEYWISGTDDYNKLMENIAEYITDEPIAVDVPVSKVFSIKMWAELKEILQAKGVNGVSRVDEMWDDDFKNRKVITGFLKDKAIGKKRLASMPDRVTNTITTTTGLVMRPTVINCFEGDLSSQESWWKLWKEFMFTSEITVMKKGRKKSLFVFETLKTITRAKYPDVTEEEEKISIALQTLAAAIFDASLVYLMNQASPGVWEKLRTEMCDKLNKGKHERVVNILNKQYSNAHVVFLQEVSSDFERAFSPSALRKTFAINHPEKADSSRGQNSVILLRKDSFGEAEEVTENVVKLLPDGVVAGGDLLVLTVSTNDGVPYLIASFHGDTNGLATIPVVDAVKNYSKTLDGVKVLFGMDANTYDSPNADQQGLLDFARFYRANKMTSCYGDYPNPKNFTTFHARTHLQTQLNKAVSLSDRDVLGDKNPKDHILFFKDDFVVLRTTKDNTGLREYTEDMVFPTLKFPSDHGITSTLLKYPSKAELRRVREEDRESAVKALRTDLDVLTWNVKEHLNNPFEAWLGDDRNSATQKKYASYEALIAAFNGFIESNEQDIAISKVFTDEMWSELKEEMTSAKMEKVAAIDELWETGYKQRKLVSGFLADPLIGKKRLTHMPDKVTNTIVTTTGTVFRPTVINCYAEELPSIEEWWAKWKKYMFHEEITITTKKGKVEKKVYQILKLIRHTEYPDISEEEEAVSFPLQTLALAMYDAALVYLMNKAVSPAEWHSVRTNLCKSLDVKGRNKLIHGILQKKYATTDVAFLQDVGSTLFTKETTKLVTHSVHLPETVALSNKNSAILLRKALFSSVVDVTSNIVSLIKSVPDVMDGELQAVTSVNKVSGETFLLCSFHGDAKGALTTPVIDGITSYATANKIVRVLIGMDSEAQSVKVPLADQLDVATLTEHLKEKRLTSCFGDNPNPNNVTSYTAKTYLQPFASRGVKRASIATLGDRRPSDHIIFDPSQFTAIATDKDSTGKGVWAEGDVFNTLSFPSSHAIVHTRLQQRDRPALPIPREAEMQVTTWNVAAVNNNPFEFWISGTEDYNTLMSNFAAYIEDPTEVDAPVADVFSEEMWEDLRVTMLAGKIEGVPKVEDYWTNTYKDKKIISEFLKDASIGKKRLVSMPDRITNTITTPDGLMYRPSVINCYESDLSSQEKWWRAWKDHMFSDRYEVGKGNPKKGYQMLKQISRAKYPDITEEEEQVSVPLQIMTLAIFDAILVHLLNKAAPLVWQDVRAEMCDKLHRNKMSGIAEILLRQYYTSDVLFLQEVGPRLLQNTYINTEFEVHIPQKFDAERKQNSVILLKKHGWANVTEVTDGITSNIQEGSPLVAGDVFALSASRHVGGVATAYILVSFHGDTNGLATKPLLDAVKEYAASFPNSRVVMGIDANTYETPKKDQLGVSDFTTYLETTGFGTSYATSSKSKGFTTCNARTHLQPQLNKAVAFADKEAKADKNPKDHLLFSSHFTLDHSSRDNTGTRTFHENMVFPTLSFPSDHSISTALLSEKRMSDMKSE